MLASGIRMSGAGWDGMGRDGCLVGRERFVGIPPFLRTRQGRQRLALVEVSTSIEGLVSEESIGAG